MCICGLKLHVTSRLLSCGRAGKEGKRKARTIIDAPVIVGEETKRGGAAASALRACNEH